MCNDIDMAAVVRALQPDNVQTPKDLKIACELGGKALICNIEMPSVEDPLRILTLRNTFDDLVINIKAAIDSLVKTSKATT